MTMQLGDHAPSPTAPSDAFVRHFIDSMPTSYRERFEPSTVKQHAAVSWGRRSQPVQVGRFADGDGSGHGICVVAKDRPGLLAAISAALSAHCLDVIRGEAHTRSASPRHREAVDLFWVRSSGSGSEPEPVADETIGALRATLHDIVTRRRDVLAPPPCVARPDRGETRVRFVDGVDGELAVLEVEADDRPGLLLAISSALRDQKVGITSCQVSTEADRARDRFVIREPNGTSITDRRRLSVQVAVLSAVDTPRH